MRNIIDHTINTRKVVTVYYYPEANVFSTEYLGSIIFDIFRLVTPGQLMVFKKNKRDYIVPDRTNSFTVELRYPDEELLPYFYEYK